MYPDNSNETRTEQPVSTAPPDVGYAHPPVYVEQPPVYAGQQETAWNMYSPGIYANHPEPRNNTSKNRSERRSAAGSFVRALCLVLVCALVSAGASYLVMDYRIDRGDFIPYTNQVVLGSTRVEHQPEESPSQLVVLPEGELSAQDIYDMALTQVVGVSITTPSNSRSFGIQGGVSSVVGTGFVITHDGFILTNYHVVEMAHALELPIDVNFYDNSSYRAEVVGYDASSDVAVLKIDATGLNPVLLGNSDDLRVGQSVYAVGNPFGDLVYTMTDGIVSALDRVVSVEGKTISTFQFSAAVNSGNSGGPVYNSYGEVIGIVTAKIIRGNVEGIGFAIPINDALDIAVGLIENGYIAGRPFIGISYPTTVTQANADYYDWVVGVYVRGVFPDSAAEKAGIHVGDIITAIADDPVDSTETLQYVLRQYNAGDTVEITIWRDGEIKALSITFDENVNAGRAYQESPPAPELPNPFEDMP